MTLIRLTAPDKSHVWVNPEQVVCVRAAHKSELGNTEIALTSTLQFVMEPPETVAMALGYD